ncbi:creatininase family protein [Chloroflexus sp.]|uniref:creatininase family protein n=1 Tax=Chloroflexus sp. TaxID=1904827 RepID=UPI002619928D|nr:creatininase family protein [uncultured Chloroflexus sp.]
MNTTPAWGRFVELRLAQQQQIISQHPIGWLPWASLTSRGAHLPRGATGLIAEAVVTGAARRVGGIIFPLLWYDRDINNPIFHQFLAAQLKSIAAQGFQMAVVIGIADTAPVDLGLIEIAETAIAQHRLLTLAVSPLELVDETMQDRGALWETSILLAIRPDLVDLSQLSSDNGHNARDLASPSLGQQALTLASEQLAKAVQEVYRHQNATAVAALYQQRRARYHKTTL